MKLKSYDVVGNIAILKFPPDIKKFDKIRVAKKLLNERKSVTTIVEKIERVKGRLRTFKTLHLAGDKTLEALYMENGCKFKMNISGCYFSSRLANERKEIANQIKKNEGVLVMFAGVGPFAIVIAKNSKAKEVYGVELGRECSKYAMENVKLNKLNNVKIVQGDVKRIVPKFGDKFDRVVMPRPNLKDSFLKEAFKVIKVEGIVNYYGFFKDKQEIINSVKQGALENKKKIKILRVKKAGEISPHKFRWRVDFKVL